MKPKAKSMMAFAAASAAAVWATSAIAASEQIICQQDPAHPSMTGCVLHAPASAPSAMGSSSNPSSPHTVTYYVIEPVERDARTIAVLPEGHAALAGRDAAELSQPFNPQAFPSESPATAEVRYVVAGSSLPTASDGEVLVIPAQRIIITQPAPAVGVVD
jgi:hypothetical protein